MREPKPMGSLELCGIAEADLLTPGLIHEMRNPLMGIQAGLQLVARELGDQVTRLEDWQLVLSQVARLEELFQSYGALMDPDEAPAVEFAVEPVVRRAVDLLAFRLKRLGGRFSASVDGTLPIAFGRPRALLHAVTNLITNALDAVEETGRAGRVEVRMLPAPGAPGRAEVRVADEGPGVPQEIRDRIFEPRFTTKAARNGTGLGLHIARRMVELGGGTVRLLDEGDGSRRAWSRTEFAVLLAEPGGAP